MIYTFMLHTSTEICRSMWHESWFFALYFHHGALLLCPCLFRPSDSVWHSRLADAPQCAHFSTVISPSWITEQISVEKCAHRVKSVRRECKTSFKIVTWTKQTCTKHHNTSTTGWSIDHKNSYMILFNFMHFTAPYFFNFDEPPIELYVDQKLKNVTPYFYREKRVVKYWVPTAFMIYTSKKLCWGI